MDYCTPNDVRSYLQDDQLSIAILRLIIPGVCRAVDTYCHRTFSPTTGSKLYDYKHPTRLILRETMVSLTGITTNAGQVITPIMTILDPIDGPPYNEISLIDGLTFAWSVTPRRAITVTGTWGYQATIPPAIRLGTTMWAADVYARSDVRALTGIRGGSTTIQVAELNEKPPADVQPYLNSFRPVIIKSPLGRSA